MYFRESVENVSPDLDWLRQIAKARNKVWTMLSAKTTEEQLKEANNFPKNKYDISKTH